MPSRIGLWPALALLLSLVLRTGPALADPDEAGAQICERAIAAGARGAGDPRRGAARDLADRDRAGAGRAAAALAVGDQSRGPGLLVRGAASEALAFARASVAAGRTSFDVGCFQINYFWHGRNFPSLEAMFDPETGADYAASFLKSLYQERGDWSAAAGAYHSQLPDRAGVYRTRFDRILAGLGGAADPGGGGRAGRRSAGRARTRRARAAPD